MWWARFKGRSSRVEAYLGRTLVGWRLAGEDATRWEATGSVEDGLAAMARWRTDDASPGRARLRVWLGSSLARPWMIAADAGVRGTAEARVLAASMARDVTGWDEAPRIWTMPWRAGRPTACVAIPQVVHATLVGGGDSPRVAVARVESVRPWWNLMLDEVLASTRATGSDVGWSLAEPDGLVCGRARAGQATELRFESPKSHDPNWVLLRRRLAINWADAASIDHREFVCDDSPIIGGTRAIEEDRDAT